MCGITGFLDPRRQLDAAGLAATARKMAGCICHRGPDDSGEWTDAEAGAALAFRRLSILDLSAAGHQPMVSEHGRFVIVFNGEIYNHRDIKAEIEQGGEPSWRGHSDTEVMLAAFERWGVLATLRRLNGMFALALWDRNTRTLTLARDRLGEKPLYYGWAGKVFVYGSELKTLRAHTAWEGRVDRRALAMYLKFRYVPTPYSIYEGVQKLEPGAFLQVEAGEDGLHAPRLEYYWSPRGAVLGSLRTPVEATDAEAIGALDAQLDRAVSLRMEADVPLGAFLSGGIDSSTVVAFMQKNATRPVRTFSIGFEDPAFDEAPAASAVARHLGTEHTEMYITAQDAMDVIPSLPSLYDEPFADSSQIPTALLSRLTRQHVTVALSGDGGDEVFAGYNRYSWGRRLLSGSERIPRRIRVAASKAMRAVSTAGWDRLSNSVMGSLPVKYRVTHPGDSIHKLARVLTAGNPADMYEALVSDWMPSSNVLLDSGASLTANGPEAIGASVAEEMMFRDLVTYLPDDILVKVDRAAMAASLETRVPFLDHNLVEFAWRLPLDLKIRDGEGKWILRRVLERYVPTTLTARPKQGFSVPIGAWIRGPLRSWAESLLDSDRLKREGLFNPRVVEKVWNEHVAGIADHQHLLWDILVFQSWLERETA
ncbi:MAG TPA: asparagine synthase (glutamine-hydrolyzing) [Gemmatimonadaceae bacterium]